MSKFLKRIGTTASKFMVELYLTKVELNLVQQCRVSIILKRGDHVVETKNAIALEKGLAKFDEKLVIPATLYLDKKKKEYMKKEATLSIQVTTPKATRLAGVSKIDLAYYPNNNQTEIEVIHQMEKCFDKNAKIHFKLRMVKVNDLIADKKGGAKKEEKKESRKASKDEEDSKENENDLSGSDLPSRINAGSSDMNDFTDNSSIPDFSNFHGLKSTTGDNGKKSPPDIDLSDDEGKSRGRTVDALRIGRDGSEDKTLKGKFDPGLSQITTDAYAGGSSQKITELEVKVKNYQRENKELYEKIREDNEEYLNLNQDYEDLKLKYERLQKEFDNVLNDKKIDKSQFTGLDRKTENDLKNYKDKVAHLEREVKDLTAERDEANERCDELNQATQDLLAKIETLKNKDKKNVKDNSESMEDYIAKINELSQKLREAEKKIRELSSPVKTQNDRSKFDVDESELENKLLKSQLEEKNNKIEELENQIGIKNNEIQLMKKMNMSAASKNKEEANHQMLAQIDQMEQKQKALEETYKKRIEELMKQLTQTKKDLEEARAQLNNNDFDNDSELAKLSIENESLKKQIKELNGKMLNVKYDNKDIEDMRRKLTQLETEKEKVDAELLKAKMGWASADNEKEELKGKLKEKEQNLVGDDLKMEEMEKEMIKLKSKFADLMNAVMEYGDEQLLDDMENIVSAPDEDGEPTATGRKTNQWVKLK